MLKNSITRRWLATTFFIITLLLLLLSLSTAIVFTNSYYETVRTTLEAHTSDIIIDYFSNYTHGTDDEFISAAINFIDIFPDKDIMEVWVIDKNGKVVVSSSGFNVPNSVTIPDYDDALSSEGERGIWTGKLPSGEKVMATTVMLPAAVDENVGAVRYIISLEEIDSQIIGISVATFVIACIMDAIVFVSGIVFVHSIVRPLKFINDAAKQIATGDLSVRVNVGNNDNEIDELCRTVNDMAYELSEADRMKNDFISTISHELRTPLTAIKGWGETLIQIGDTDAELSQKGMGVIISEAQRLSEMVEELLDFSRIQGGSLILQTAKIDVLAELDEAVFVLKERATREAIEVIYNVPHLPAPMQGDANRIKQVFVNIIDNSIKYTEHGGKIVILAELSVDNKLVIYFTDTGCGIAPEDIPKVKEKFFKANLSVRGSGIGLAVADEIITLHGGSIEINSVVGEGTTVTVTLPIEPTALQEERIITDNE